MGFGDDFKDQEPGIRNKYALLIGANTTNASNAPLIGVTSDLEKFGKILGDSRHSEFEVISLLNESPGLAGKLKKTMLFFSIIPALLD